ncbi:hypothetical protein [Specibacter sp. RAF43]|uniref:hypothetical protein n=1 Tax=Specibacter sp. RAF43 TaxID=3233057 RepID=UPI003F9A4931
MHTLILLAATTPPPAPTPTLRPGLTDDQIGPGLLGFLAMFFIVAIMFFLIRDMVKRIRRVRYREMVEGGAHGPDAEQPGIPVVSDDAGTRPGAQAPDRADAPDAGGAQTPGGAPDKSAK